MTNPRHALDDVEVEAGGRQAECVVHRDGARWLQAGPAHAGVDHQADLRSVDPGGSDRLLSGGGSSIGERDAVRPLAALTDPGERFEQAGLAVGALVERCETSVDLVRGHDDWCLVELDGDDRDVIETEVGVLDHLILGIDRMVPPPY